ncbi:hypothetical protein M2651_05885 [Clostridium sp. SYSU_GA19001]|uniref:hypothetical protein n=1 Tax=Clostridium caldaquaticum TaxID=2940653 RepID=UPI002076F6B5|nr:hypothetical protein [Clostridium caldaquaticum]MCM8710556.1 hypothetical protein [Clostridium caldaquaticum]
MSRKTISMDNKVIEKGEKRAEQLGMTFSGYLTYLINKDCGEIAATLESVKKTKDNKIRNAIDNILGD